MRNWVLDRGTLASDALRVLHSAGFAGEVHFVETSPILRAVQKEAVPNAQWHGSVIELPAMPLLLVANEFLDALPVKQHVGGMERRIGIAGGGLAFDRDGEITESSPARDEAVAAIAPCLAAKGGVALVIDYGHERRSAGDTLQAVRGHAFSPVLDNPGEQDLTAHVDFDAVGRAPPTRALSSRPSSLSANGSFGPRNRCSRSGAVECKSERAEDIEGSLHRLTGDGPDGRPVQGDRAPFEGMASAGGLRMNCRDATPRDLPAIDRVFRTSFCDTFAIYRPRISPTFLSNSRSRRWRDRVQRSPISLPPLLRSMATRVSVM